MPQHENQVKIFWIFVNVLVNISSLPHTPYIYTNNNWTRLTVSYTICMLPKTNNHQKKKQLGLIQLFKGKIHFIFPCKTNIPKIRSDQLKQSFLF